MKHSKQQDKIKTPGPVDRCRLNRRLFTLAFAVLVVSVFPPEVFARAGGGRHGGGSLIVYLILLPFFVIYGLYVNRRIKKKKQMTEEAMTRLAAKDPVWDERQLEAFVREDFFRIEKAWCEKDFATLRERLDVDLFAEWKAQLDLMASQRHRNVLEDLHLDQVRFVEVKDYPVKDRDEFTVCLDAGATDYTVNDAGEIVDSNTSSRRARNRKEKKEASFREFWTYHRKGEQWKLAAIDQSGQWRNSVDAPIVEEGQVRSKGA